MEIRRISKSDMNFQVAVSDSLCLWLRVKQERLRILEQACRAFYFDIPQAIALLLQLELDRTRESALVMLFCKITQRDKLYSVINVFSQTSRLNLHKRLGPWWFVNKQCPNGKYWLDLGKNNDQDTIKCLLDYHKKHPYSSHFRDVRFAQTASQALVHHQVCQISDPACSQLLLTSPRVVLLSSCTG
jgi:hypothetical protein